MLDTSRNLRSIRILTCDRRFKRRSQVNIGGLGVVRGLACEPFSPARRARGGQERCVEQRARNAGRCLTDLDFKPIYVFRPALLRSVAVTHVGNGVFRFAGAH